MATHALTVPFPPVVADAATAPTAITAPASNSAPRIPHPSSSWTTPGRAPDRRITGWGGSLPAARAGDQMPEG
ncbi:MAG: hypothetical protein U0237_10910 [Thermoleophilia bacterium]